MVARAAAALLGLLFLASLIFVGVVCAAFAIDEALVNSVGVAGAAAITALLFLAGPVIALMVFALRRPRESPLVALLSSASSPLAAILGAGAVGLAEAFLRKRKRRD
ncbi:MAG TPA: hypothetical protein VLT91_01425 [Rhizomicrobium sp.]|nr:hypothetical protein [Rhizomicrobium sp.]